MTSKNQKAQIDSISSKIEQLSEEFLITKTATPDNIISSTENINYSKLLGTCQMLHRKLQTQKH